MVQGVDHIGIAVASIAEARGFYEQLGLGVDSIEEVPAEGVRVAMIRCGGVWIELLEPTSDDSPIAKFLAKKGPGLHHVCLASSDVRADSVALASSGVPLLRAEPTRGAGGSWVQFVHPKGAGGVLFELAESAQDS